MQFYSELLIIWKNTAHFLQVHFVSGNTFLVVPCNNEVTKLTVALQFF